MSLNDFMMKIPPQALLGLASGLLSPGQSTGARFGAGLAGMNQGMLVSQLMASRQAQAEEAELKRKQEQEKLEALKRVQSTLEGNATVDEASKYYPGFITEPMRQNPAQADLMTLDPEGTIKRAAEKKDPWDPYKVAGRDIFEIGVDGKPKIAASGTADERTNTKQAWDKTQNRTVFVTEAQIAAEPARYSPVPSGMKIESDGQGGFKMVTGEMAASGDTQGLTSATRNILQKDVLQTREGLARLAGIEEQFNPEFQQIVPRAQNLWTAFKDKTGRAISRADADELRKFSGFKADALNNINLYIKEITGAAMSNAEAARIQQGVPNPGSGLFDGDSPTQFQAKLDATMKRLRAVNARQSYALKHGLTVDAMQAIPIDSVNKLIDDRGKDLEADVRAKNPTASSEEIDALVLQLLRQEFGQ